MKNHKNYVCPVWMAHTFDNPLRKLFHNPKKMFTEYVKEGMTVMDIGCGFGCFSIGLAKMVGKNGKVYSVDLQKGMLDRLMKRAKKAGVVDIIETHQCESCKIGLDARLDFALAFWMIHETPDAIDLLKQIHSLLKPGGVLFLANPKMHVPLSFFDETISAAEKIGFKIIERPKISLSWTVVLSRK